MVKGTAKQAVIVSPREPGGFEQAIFILSPQTDREILEKPEDLLRLADRIAGQYLVTALPKKRDWQKALVLAGCFIGGLLVGVLL